MPSALVPAASTARQASLAWRLSLLTARGATETVPKAETSEPSQARLDEDEKRLRRGKRTRRRCCEGRGRNESVCSFERSSLASRVPNTFSQTEPSRAVTAYKTDTAIASWMEKRKQKEQARMLLRVRPRARGDLDWILTRRKAQIATCRREVKNDKATKRYERKRRERAEKLAVAPPTETTNEASSPNRQTRERDAFGSRRERRLRKKRDASISNLARGDANDTRTRIANVHRDASVPAVAAHAPG